MGQLPLERRVGVRDVARAAGVSTQTVSRALNDYPGMRPETRERVLAAVEHLGYRMNNAARALGTNTTRTLGLVASNSRMFGPAAAIEAVDAAARQYQHWVAMAFADPAEGPRAVADAVTHLVAQGVDGILVLVPDEQSLVGARVAAGAVPVRALTDAGSAERQRHGAARAVAHLREQGHTRVAMLAGPRSWTDAAARREGGEAAQPMIDVWEGEWTATSGAAHAPAVAAAVRREGGPTAIAVANDQMALGLIAGLTLEGLRVPKDVSIIGFDDNPDAAYYRPGLSTVRLDVAGEARRAVHEVLGVAGAAPVVAEPLLVSRASVRAR